MKHSEKEIAKLDKFIKETHTYLTLLDIVQEQSDFNENFIRNRCIALDIKPITILERNNKFLLDFHKFKTVKQLAKLLDIGEERVRQLCRILNITPLKKSETIQEEEIELEKQSAGKILSNYKISNKHHYDELNPNSNQIKK